MKHWIVNFKEDGRVEFVEGRWAGYSSKKLALQTTLRMIKLDRMRVIHDLNQSMNDYEDVNNQYQGLIKAAKENRIRL